MLPQTLHVHSRALPRILIKRKLVHIPDHPRTRTHPRSAAPAPSRPEARRGGHHRARRGRGSLSAEEKVQKRLLRLRRLGRVVLVLVLVPMGPVQLSRDDGSGGAADRCP